MILRIMDLIPYPFIPIQFHCNYTRKEKSIILQKLRFNKFCLTHMSERENGERFPDVFSSSFRNKLDSLAKDICSPLKDAKYLIGYTF